MKTALFIVGAVSEFAGIVMIAFPDLLPGAQRVSAWIARRARVIENRVRRLLKQPPRQIVHSASAGGAVTMGGGASAVVGLDPNTTPEQKLEFLLRRDQESQKALNTIARRVGEIEKNTPKQLEELRAGMQDHGAHEVAAAGEEYRHLRVAGTFALAIGLICVTTANFV